MPERLGDQVQFEDGEVANSALDPRHVGPIEPSSIGQCLLRQAAVLAKFSHTPPQGTQKRLGTPGRRFRHSPMLRACGLSVHGL
jgi:hypothetical protein